MQIKDGNYLKPYKELEKTPRKQKTCQNIENDNHEKKFVDLSKANQWEMIT